MSESFVFYRSFIDAVEKTKLNDEGQLKLIKAIINYGIDGIEPKEDEEPIVQAVVALVKPQIDANTKRRVNGNKGGRKKPSVSNSETNGLQNKNQWLQHQEPMVINSETNGYESNNHRLATSEPNVNVNVNDNVNDNVNGNVNVNGSASADDSHPHFTQSEVDSLINDFGEETANHYIDRIETYSAENNKEYKDFNKTVRSWITKDGIQKRDGHLDKYESNVNCFELEAFEEVI